MYHLSKPLINLGMRLSPAQMKLCQWSQNFCIFLRWLIITCDHNVINMLPLHLDLKTRKLKIFTISYVWKNFPPRAGRRDSLALCHILVCPMAVLRQMLHGPLRQTAVLKCTHLRLLLYYCKEPGLNCLCKRRYFKFFLRPQCRKLHFAM